MRSVGYAALLTAGLLGVPPAFADDPVTPAEIIEKVNSAASYLAENGAAGLDTLNSARSEFVWKDSYVFVYDCDADVIAAHPVAESRGVTISDLEGGRGEAFGLDLCEAAKAPKGSWTVYYWPRPVESSDDADDLAYEGDFLRKVSYIRQVPGTPYQVGAGMFDETTSLEDLDGMIE